MSIWPQAWEIDGLEVLPGPGIFPRAPSKLKLNGKGRGMSTQPTSPFKHHTSHQSPTTTTTDSQLLPLFSWSGITSYISPNLISFTYPMLCMRTTPHLLPCSMAHHLCSACTHRPSASPQWHTASTPLAYMTPRWNLAEGKQNQVTWTPCCKHRWNHTTVTILLS